MGPINPLSSSDSGLNNILSHLSAINTNNRNRRTGGGSFNEVEKAAVWNKAAVIPGWDARFWRKDACGAHIKWSDYGNTSSNFGWEIDHIRPVAHGGTDALANLQALHWQNNRNKGDSLGSNYCAVSYGEK